MCVSSRQIPYAIGQFTVNELRHDVIFQSKLCSRRRMPTVTSPTANGTESSFKCSSDLLMLLRLSIDKIYHLCHLVSCILYTSCVYLDSFQDSYRSCPTIKILWWEKLLCTRAFHRGYPGIQEKQRALPRNAMTAEAVHFEMPSPRKMTRESNLLLPMNTVLVRAPNYTRKVRVHWQHPKRYM